ncbi:MAG: BspA family leucine-rich repeat surface protein [Saccharospirillaceae bacterium]|nr:BspA family leucine-rich repeat surface protein [Saccharospirillaceae bacterium]
MSLRLSSNVLLCSLFIIQSCQLQSDSNASNQYTSTNAEQIDDTQPPALTLNGNQTIDVYVNSSYSELGASVTDNVDSDLSVNILNEVDTTLLGTIYVNYQAEDVAGNQSTVTRTVNIIEAPFIFTWDTNPSDVSIDYDTYLSEHSESDKAYLGEDQLNIQISTDHYNFPNEDNFTIDWGDGHIDENVTGSITHLYEPFQIYTVTMTGTYPTVKINCPSTLVSSTAQIKNLMDIQQWGSNSWKTMSRFFNKCNLRSISAQDKPNLTHTSSMGQMFKFAHYFNDDISHWDLSNVTNISGMFSQAKSFNQPLDNWNVSNVESMSGLFKNAELFNQDLNSWDVSKVSFFTGIFSDASNFNGKIDQWDLSNATSMNSMFSGAKAFNQDISDWSISNVEYINYLFRDAESFNQPIGIWNTSKIKSMHSTFKHAKAFNQDLLNWDTSSVTTMNSTFYGAASFNQNIIDWDVSKVTNMEYMFHNAFEFNQPLNAWNTSNVNSMQSIFVAAVEFNQPLDNWDISNVINLSSAFHHALNFDQSLASWNISNVTDMGGLFTDVNFSVSHYDALLISWGNQLVQDYIYFSAGTNQYTPSVEVLNARARLIDVYGWFIDDAGSTQNDPD